MKNDKTIKILYDLYCRKPMQNQKNILPIKSAFSLNEYNHKNNFNKKMNDFNLFKNTINFQYAKNLNNNNYIINNNKKRWLFRLLKLKKVNMYHYDKHYGNTESCPLCQEMEKKNEESIVKKGIPILRDNKKNELKSSKTTLHNRRVYSACSKYYRKKNKNESSKSDIENNNDDNKRKILDKNKISLNNIIVKEKNNKKPTINIIRKKLEINKVIYNEKNFSSYSNNNN